MSSSTAVLSDPRWLSSLNTGYLTSYICRYAKTTTLQVASRLTDPVCKSHELFRRIQIVDALHPNSWKAVNIGRKCLLGLGMVTFGCLATVTTVPGIFLRWVVSKTEQDPYIYWEGGLKEDKVLEDNKFSLFFWNILGTNAGHVITDGGALPWRFRIDAIINEIKNQNADVISLCEVFDINAALGLYSGLKNEYAHFYFGMGHRPIGAPFAFLVASKFKISDPKFTAFPKELLIGRTKNAEKGWFEFDIQSQKRSFARIFTTHLQHSEEYTSPKDPNAVAQKIAAAERTARKGEMEMIMKEVEKVEGKVPILTGDLNIYYEDELEGSWYQCFEEADNVKNKPTWGGDGFCGGLVGKKPSPPLKLDFTMFLKGTAQSIHTTLVKTGFEGNKFKPEALSDHDGLRSIIEIKA